MRTAGIFQGMLTREAETAANTASTDAALRNQHAIAGRVIDDSVGIVRRRYGVGRARQIEPLVGGIDGDIIPASRAADFHRAPDGVLSDRLGQGKSATEREQKAHLGGQSV